MGDTSATPEGHEHLVPQLIRSGNELMWPTPAQAWQALTQRATSEPQVVHQISMPLDRSHPRYGQDVTVTVREADGSPRVLGSAQTIEDYFSSRPKTTFAVELAPGLAVTLWMPRAQADEMAAVGWDERRIAQLLQAGMEQHLARGTITEDELADWIARLAGHPVFFCLVDTSPALWADHLASIGADGLPMPRLFANRALLEAKQEAQRLLKEDRKSVV